MTRATTEAISIEAGWAPDGQLTGRGAYDRDGQDPTRGTSHRGCGIGKQTWALRILGK